MDSRELRIGNTVFINGLHGENFIGTVSSITSKGALSDDRRVIFFQEDNERLGEFLCDCSGIPVNEEILYKLGAVKFPSGKMLSLCDRLLDHMECRDVWIDTQTSVELKYVHQVQNFIYATKGIELSLSGSGKV